jgi:hypothetical protein
MKVPKGTLISGKTHATETIGVMTKGKMRIWGEDGIAITVEAPYTHVGKIGYKRVGFAVEDVEWVTIHRTDSTDLEEIERTEFVPDESGVDMFDFATGKLKPQNELDRADFHRMLSEYGISHEQATIESERTEDRVDLDLSMLHVELFDSPIARKGVRARMPFPPDEVIGPANMGGMRTQLGRYVNHSFKPNAEMVIINGDVVLVALTSISCDDEITTDYRKMLAIRAAISEREG